MRTLLSHLLGAAMTAVLLLLALALGSCGPDTVVVPDLAESSLPFPDTPDQLMLNYQTAYGSRSLADYAATLHPDFAFVETDGGTYGRDVELRIAARMFSGEDYVSTAGTIAGITRIEWLELRGLGAWEDVADGDRDAVRRAYRVDLRFHRTDQSVLSVRGRAVFTLVREPAALEDGTPRVGFRVWRIEDRTD